MNLIDVYGLGEPNRFIAINILYEILEERPLEHGISHKTMPSFQQHHEFVLSRPFRYWYIIQMDGGMFAGAIECLPTNEFGIHILKEYQDLRLGTQAVELFLSTHEPLPAIPAIRNGHWLANCAPANEGAMEFFKKLGFHEIQRTFEL